MRQCPELLDPIAVLVLLLTVCSSVLKLVKWYRSNTNWSSWFVQVNFTGTINVWFPSIYRCGCNRYFGDRTTNEADDLRCLGIIFLSGTVWRWSCVCVCVICTVKEWTANLIFDGGTVYEHQFVILCVSTMHKYSTPGRVKLKPTALVFLRSAGMECRAQHFPLAGWWKSF